MPRPLRHDLVDAAVLEVHGLVREQGWLADRALERVLRRERRLYSTERRAAAEAVYGLLRAEGQLRWLAGETQFVVGVPAPATAAGDEPPPYGPREAGARPSGGSAPARGTDPRPSGGSAAARGAGARPVPAAAGDRARSAGPRPVLDPATLYALWLARTGAAAPAEAARRLGVPAKVIAAALDRADARVAAIADPAERLAVEASLPRWIAERFLQELPGEARALALALGARAPLTVRTNLLKTTREALRARLAEEGAAAAPTRFSPWGLTLDGHENAFQLPSFQDGLFEIQDEGSQLLALAVAARPGWTVADACAGAGGKSLALAAEMHGKGSLWALDVDADRLSEARRRARRAGAHNLRVRQLPAGAEADAALEDLAGRCERVLVDAPCSGLGALRRKPDARWRLAPEDPARFAALQEELVLRFARLVKPGGRLVYATCALGRTENEAVAERAAAALDGFERLPVAAALGPELAAALGADGLALTLLPHRHGTDGFFCAAFQRRR